MKKLILTSLTLLATAVLLAQTPVFTIDFEDGSTMPEGITLSNGAMTNNGTADSAEIVTEATDACAKSGTKSLQMANSGYLSFDNSQLTEFKTFTLGFWMKWQDIASEQDTMVSSSAFDYFNIIGTHSGSKTGRTLGINKFDKSLVYTTAGESSDAYGYDAEGKGQAQWVHVFVSSGILQTYPDKPVEQGSTKLYLNGDSVFWRPIAGSVVAFDAAAAVNYYIGARINYDGTPLLKNGVYNGLCGYIDDVTLYDEELTSTQISAIYAEMTGGESALANVQEANINVYSPVQGLVKITSPESFDNARATVYSINGQIVAQKSFQGNETSMDLNAGLYIVKLSTAKGVYTQKVVVK